MGFFSVLAPEGGGAPYRVAACHLNIWSLKGLLGHRPMLFDVGLRIQVAEPIQQIDLVVPVASVPRIVNLSDLVNKSDVARLLFGRHFDRVDNGVLHLHGADPATIVHVDGDHTTTEETYKKHGLTIVPLRLTAPLKPQTCVYLRARLVVDHAGAMWRWNRALGRRNGALIDLRVPDPREGGAAPELPALYERALPLEQLEVFVMLPERFQLRAANPDLRYTRTLEGRAWKPYLRRSATGPLARERVMVHRWAAVDASDKHPFRGFLQVARHPPLHSITDHVVTATAVVVAGLALFSDATVRPELVDAASAVGEALWSTVGKWVIGGATVVALAAWGVGKVRKAPATFAKVKRAFKAVEYRWFYLWR
jgi:hypothetical protein